MKLARPLGRSKKERAPAARAEPALRSERRLVPAEQALAIDDAAPCLLHPDPRDERRAVRAPAHRAVAMRDPLARQLDAKLDASAEAGSGRVGHGTQLKRFSIRRHRK